MQDFSMYIPKVKFELIPIKNLVASQEYQRNLSASHIQRIADNFDTYLVNPIKVSRRNGINYVFDGQHTIEAIEKVSGSRETPAWCMVYDDLDYENEADIFAKQQKWVKPLVSFDVFKANIEAENDDELKIKALVESYGMYISGTKQPGAICAVSTLINIYQLHGYDILDRVLRLCIGAWEGDMNSFSMSMLNGIMHLVVAYGDKLDDKLFKEKVGNVSVKEIVRTAKERRQGSVGYADVMLNIYNKQMKNPLNWVKLRQSPKKTHNQVSVVELNNNNESQAQSIVTEATEAERSEMDEQKANQPIV